MQLLCIEVWFTDKSSRTLDKEDKITKVRIEPRDRIFVKGYRFSSFAENIGKNIGKNVGKKVSSKYSQNFLNYAKQSV